MKIHDVSALESIYTRPATMTQPQGMVLALEYQKLRGQGLSASFALKEMQRWREEVNERLLKRAETAGLPEHVQTLVSELNAEVRALTSTLAKAVL